MNNGTRIGGWLAWSVAACMAFGGLAGPAGAEDFLDNPSGPAPAAVKEAESGPVAANAVLSTRSPWRAFFAFGDELVRWESGQASAARFEQVGRSRNLVKAEDAPPIESPQGDWAAVGFDDSTWAATPGPLLHRPNRRDLATIYLRGRFEVVDPASAGLTLSLAYRGGAVVYLNGQEVGRGHMDDGPVKPGTPAMDYPKELYLDKEGNLLDTSPGSPKAPNPNLELLKQRVRRLELKLPEAGLVKGVNLLAIELHRAPTAELYHKTPRKERAKVDWSMLGFESLALTPASDAAVRPNRGDPKEGSLLVWPGCPLAEMFDTEPGDPMAAGTIQPVTIAAARNGAFDGVVLVRSAQTITGLKATVSELTLEAPGPGPGQPGSPGAIASSDVQVRYGIAGHPAPPITAARYPAPAKFLGFLAEQPSAQAVGALPIWLTVHVPKDAPAGNYRGKLTISANSQTLSVPIQLNVADFALPNTKDFVSFVGLVESPESVALQYNVPLWSDEHFKLLDKCFQFLGQAGVNSAYVPLIAQTNLGNEESILRWVKRPDGSLTHDFTAVEKYLDLVAKYLTGNPIVCFYVWTPTLGGGSFNKTPDATDPEVKKKLKPLLFTVVDSDGKVANENGPDWGTPQSIAFWKPVFEKLRKLLADRKLEKSMALGLPEDFTPTKQTVDDMNVVAPEAAWVGHSHGGIKSFGGKPTAEDCIVWASPAIRYSTDKNKRYGWRNPACLTVYPRYGSCTVGTLDAICPLGQFHIVVEAIQTGGARGVSRLGLDYFPVVKNVRGQTSGVISRFPTRARPGNPMLSGGDTFLAPLPGEPAATVRFEALRLGVQETETRIYIEKALLDPGQRTRLGDELADRCARLLDERVTAMLRGKEDVPTSGLGSDASWLWYAATWSDRAGRLYQAAADVARALAAK